MHERNNSHQSNVKIPFFLREEDLTLKVVRSILKVWLLTIILSNYKTLLAPVKMKDYNIKNLALIYTYLDRWWIIEVNSCSTKEWWDILLPQINKQKSTIYSWLLGKRQVKIVWKILKSSLKDKNSLLDLRESDLPNYVQTALSQPKDKTYLQIK